MLNPCSRWVGLGRVQDIQDTNLLLRAIIELYPDLLLGRRRVRVRMKMRMGEGEWCKTKGLLVHW